MANVGFDLETVITEEMDRHAQRGCAFRPGAAERLFASPEFAALAALLEAEETECPSKTAALIGGVSTQAGRDDRMVITPPLSPPGGVESRSGR